MAGRGQGLLGVGVACPLKGQKNNNNCTGKAEGDGSQGSQGSDDHSRGNLAKPEDCLPRSLITAEAVGQEPEPQSLGSLFHKSCPTQRPSETNARLPGSALVRIC